MSIINYYDNLTSSITLISENINRQNNFWWNKLFENQTNESIDLAEFILRIFGGFVGVLLIISTLIGNILVILVVIRYNRMRTVTNVLLASLAIADITVASLVMPFMVIYDFIRRWPFGSMACHFWISCDVMCCTSSILHLCCVAIDRFWAITRPLRYRTCVSKRRLFCCISIIWFCSAAISFIPIFAGWYHDGSVTNIFSMDDTPDCSLKVNRVYAVVSSLTSFYMPLPIMFYVYFRILLVAERQSREIKQLELSLQQNGLIYDDSTAISSHGLPKLTVSRVSFGDGEGSVEGRSSSNYNHDAVSLGGNSTDTSSSDVKRHVERSLRRRTKQLITDTKAIRTLGIVMGVFCLCWLPFFIMYVVSAYCEDCNISYEIKSCVTWLGYLNSALNPAIYAFMNKEFKTAFKRILCCLPRMYFDEDRWMMDELSTTSRSAHRMERVNVSGSVSGKDHQPSTPGMMTRTPSATPNEFQWPLFTGGSHTGNNLSPASCLSRNPSISTDSDVKQTDRN